MDGADRQDGSIEGRVQPRGGAWQPIAGAHLDGKKLIVDLAHAGTGPASRWELLAPTAGKLIGIEKRGDTDGRCLPA